MFLGKTIYSHNDPTRHIMDTGEFHAGDNLGLASHPGGSRNNPSCFKLPTLGVWAAALRTFARKFSNIDFFLKILPLKDDELEMSEM